MTDKEKVIQAIFDAIDEVNSALPGDQQLEKSKVYYTLPPRNLPAFNEIK